jgi:hypothetical protein
MRNSMPHFLNHTICIHCSESFTFNAEYHFRSNLPSVTWITLTPPYSRSYRLCCVPAGCRGREVRNSTSDSWVVGSNPGLCPGSCPDDWLAQFSLTHVHKGGLKQYSFHLCCFPCTHYDVYCLQGNEQCGYIDFLLDADTYNCVGILNRYNNNMNDI